MNHPKQLLTLWTIYDHPLDCPHAFIARKYLIGVTPGEPHATNDIIVDTDLEAIRKRMMKAGLYCLHRSPGDDPTIIETWI